MKKNQNPLNGDIKHDIEALINFTGKEIIEEKNKFLEFAKNAIAQATSEQLQEMIKNENFVTQETLGENIIKEIINQVDGTEKEEILQNVSQQVNKADLGNIATVYEVLQSLNNTGEYSPESIDPIKTNIKNRMHDIIKDSNQTQLIEILKDKEFGPIFKLMNESEIVDTSKEKVTNVLKTANTQDLLDIAKNEEVLGASYVKDAIEKKAKADEIEKNYHLTGLVIADYPFNYLTEEIEKNLKILDLIDKHTIKQLSDDKHKHTDKYKKDVIRIINKASTEELPDLAQNKDILKHEYVKDAIEKRAKLESSPVFEIEGKLHSRDVDPQQEEQSAQTLQLIKQFTIKQLSDDKHEHTDKYKKDVLSIINKASPKELLDLAKNKDILKHEYVKDAIEKKAREGITGKLSPGFIGIFSSKSKDEARKKQEVLDLLQGKDKEKIIGQLSNDQHNDADKYKKDVLSIINKASTKELLALVDNEAVLKHEYVRNAIEKKAKEGITGKLSPGFIGAFNSAYEEKAIQKREILKKIKDSKNRVNQEVIGKNETPDPHSNKIDPKKQHPYTSKKVKNTAASLKNNLKMQQINLMRSSSNQGLKNKDPLKEKTGQSL